MSEETTQPPVRYEGTVATIKNIRDNDMIQDPETLEIWHFGYELGAGYNRSDDHKKDRVFMMWRYKPAYRQTTITSREFNAKRYIKLGEKFSRAKHCPPGPVPEPALKGVDNGWLSPDGVLYPCLYGKHYSLADKIMFHGVVPYPTRRGNREWTGGECARHLEGLGWAKLWTSDDHFYFVTEDLMLRFTKRQRDTILEWCSVNGKNPYGYTEDD